VLVVEQNEGDGGDRADAPGAESGSAQRLEGGLEQEVAAFGWGPGGRVQQVDGALVGGEPWPELCLMGVVSAPRSPPSRGRPARRGPRLHSINNTASHGPRV
jgi:hypothetical protein